jgi:hypothetical protein
MLIQLLIQEKEPTMRTWYVTLLSIVVVLTFLVMPPTWAGEQSGHVMVTPADLQWADIPSLPVITQPGSNKEPMGERAFWMA